MKENKEETPPTPAPVLASKSEIRSPKSLCTIIADR